MVSKGEYRLQEQFGTTSKALSFYNNQTLEYLNIDMMDFIAKQNMIFISTADSQGNCDASFRAGKTGFVRVLDSGRQLAYPEYRGNGVYASLGNIYENAHIGLLFIDFSKSVGLHVNGEARIISNEEIEQFQGFSEQSNDKHEIHSECWVIVHVQEAYIHCSKHIPRMQLGENNNCQDTESERIKGDYFNVKKAKC